MPTSSNSIIETTTYLFISSWVNGSWFHMNIKSRSKAPAMTGWMFTIRLDNTVAVNCVPTIWKNKKPSEYARLFSTWCSSLNPQFYPITEMAFMPSMDIMNTRAQKETRESEKRRRGEEGEGKDQSHRVPFLAQICICSGENREIASYLLITNTFCDRIYSVIATTLSKQYFCHQCSRRHISRQTLHRQSSKRWLWWGIVEWRYWQQCWSVSQ